MENEVTIASKGQGQIWRILGWGGAVSLILAPLIAMQFTREVNWTPLDFAFAIVVLGSVGLMLEIIVRRTRNGAYRAAMAAALLAAVLEIWVNSAVGIVGDEGDPVNLLFVGIIGLALAGSVVVKGRAWAMANIMYVTATVQLTAVGATWFIYWDRGSLFTVPFAGLWAVSAILFRKAANENYPS